MLHLILSWKQMSAVKFYYTDAYRCGTIKWRQYYWWYYIIYFCLQGSKNIMAKLFAQIMCPICGTFLPFIVHLWSNWGADLEMSLLTCHICLYVCATICLLHPIAWHICWWSAVLFFVEILTCACVSRSGSPCIYRCTRGHARHAIFQLYVDYTKGSHKFSNITQQSYIQL